MLYHVLVSICTILIVVQVVSLLRTEILLRRILAGLIFFFPALLPESEQVVSFSLPRSAMEVMLIVGICFVVVLFSRFIAVKEETIRVYPEIRSTNWTPVLYLNNSCAWLFYLIGYEYLFRGYLFFNTLPHAGPVSASLLNAVLYAAAHIPKGRRESLGSLPFGLLLCSVTLYTSSVFGALCIHLTLSTSTEMIALHQRNKTASTTIN